MAAEDEKGEITDKSVSSPLPMIQAAQEFPSNLKMHRVERTAQICQATICRFPQCIAR
jgi:hypothetical protein